MRISKEVASDFELSEGSAVQILSTGNGIMIKPVEKPTKYTLNELVKKITPQNKHTLVDWGKPQGKEIW